MMYLKMYLICTQQVLLIKVLFIPEREELYAEAPDGRKLFLPLSGGGFTPLELALAALGACTCIEVYKLLSIRGGLVEEISVDVVVKKERGEFNKFKLPHQGR